MITLNDLVEAVLDFIDCKTTVEELVKEVHSFDANSLDRELRSPLQREAEDGNVELVKILIANGAKINVYDDNNRNALHLAKDVYVMDALLEHATLDEINALDDDWRTPLHYASTTGNMTMMRRLIEKGADVNMLKEDGGRTALQEAAWECRSDEVILLLQSGASNKYRDNDGYLAWHYARTRHRSEKYWENEVMPQLV